MGDNHAGQARQETPKAKADAIMHEELRVWVNANGCDPSRGEVIRGARQSPNAVHGPVPGVIARQDLERMRGSETHPIRAHRPEETH